MHHNQTSRHSPCPVQAPWTALPSVHQCLSCAGYPGPAHVQDLGSISFSPGTEVRRFLPVLEGATWAEMIITAGPMHDSPRRA